MKDFDTLLEDIKKQIANPPKPIKPKAQTPRQQSDVMKELEQLKQFITKK